MRTNFIILQQPRFNAIYLDLRSRPIPPAAHVNLEFLMGGIPSAQLGWAGMRSHLLWVRRFGIVLPPRDFFETDYSISLLMCNHFWFECNGFAKLSSLWTFLLRDTANDISTMVHRPMGGGTLMLWSILSVISLLCREEAMLPVTMKLDWTQTVWNQAHGGVLPTELQ